MSVHRKDLIIKKLKLSPISEEGGNFSETYRSNFDINTDAEGTSRNLLTVIYYLMSADSGGRNYIHKNRSDIVHFFQGGWPAQYITVSPEGKYEEFVLGPNVMNGESMQLTVKGGYLKAARVMTERTEYESFPGEIPFTLISEAVSPGFDYRDRHVPSKNEVKELFPGLFSKLQPYVQPEEMQKNKESSLDLD